MYELYNGNKTEKNHSIFLYRSRIGHGLYSFIYAACVGSYILHALYKLTIM